ncbi:MAG: AAA family ATPase [Gemmatales bacterium]|nr:AAA family ATPase [Gemmatales bacterium]MDW7995221.1 AAA family ATPase [Gemmatales bacterium]
MWYRFFGLQHLPFSPVSDAQKPLLPTQQVATQELLERLHEGHRIVLLVGENGVGKTTLLARFAHTMQAERNVIWLPPGSPKDPASLYQSILFDANLPWYPVEVTPNPIWETTCRLRVVEWLLSQSDLARPTLIFAEDVHTWPDSVLREWRCLIQLNIGALPAVQVILSAKPQLLERLRERSLSELAESIGYCVWLEPLTTEQARQHIEQTFAEAGVVADHVIEPAATRLLLEHTQGVIRKLHQAITRALQLAHLQQTKPIRLIHAYAALQELGFVDSEEESLVSAAKSSAA